MKYKSLFFLLLIPFISLQAQTTKEEVMANILQAGGTYYSYPSPTGKLTPAPKGYKPFYISHYGRHGSRHIISDKQYKYAIEKLDSASKCNALTPIGHDVLGRLAIAYKDAYKRAGELSKLGARQHQAIAARMFHNYPEVFSLPTQIDARASIVMRCALSMSNFCQELRALNPKLQISMDSSDRDMWYIANWNDSIAKSPNDSIIKVQLSAFSSKMHHPERLMDLLFSNKDFVKNNINSNRMMDCLYNIAEDMQCRPELNLSFFDLFNKEELFDLWQSDNANWYCSIGLYPNSTPYYKEHYNLLRNILDTADKAIKNGKTSVTLRFGHDSVVAPLSFLLRLKGCDKTIANFDDIYTYWANFKIVPMAGNIQLIFYRKPGSQDVLVKFLQNEHETSIPVKTNCAPYYHWKDVEAFYRTELNN